MKDIIDERDEKERIKKSIIKYWNVNYVPKPQAQEDSLNNEGQLNADAQGADCDMAEAEVDEMYNVATGSYSGNYGKNEVDEVTLGQIDKILQEKTEALRDLIKNVDEEMKEE